MSSKRLPLSCENCRRRKIRCIPILDTTTIYTCHLKLLLQRPWLNNPTDTGPGHISNSAQRCEIAAETMLSSFEKLCSTNPEFRQYRWYVDSLRPFYAFFAITTLLVLGSGRGGATSANDMMLRCVQFLVRNASRSEVCSKAASILEPIVSTATQQPMITDGASGNHHETAQPEASLEDDAVWSSFPELEDLFYDVPPEQWIMPSLALWMLRRHRETILRCIQGLDSGKLVT